jgi:hypothetical protein
MPSVSSINTATEIIAAHLDTPEGEPDAYDGLIGTIATEFDKLKNDLKKAKAELALRDMKVVAAAHPAVVGKKPRGGVGTGNDFSHLMQKVATPLKKGEATKVDDFAFVAERSNFKAKALSIIRWDNLQLPDGPTTVKGMFDTLITAGMAHGDEKGVRNSTVIAGILWGCMPEATRSMIVEEMKTM